MGGGSVSYCRDHGNGLLEAVFVLMEVMECHVGRGMSRDRPDIADGRTRVGRQGYERMPQGMEPDDDLGSRVRYDARPTNVYATMMTSARRP